MSTTEIMEKLNGIDMDAAGRVAGNGFYYLMGNIARLHSAVLSYARDFMIGRGFTYCIPPGAGFIYRREWINLHADAWRLCPCSFVQLRIAKVNPFPPIDETSTWRNAIGKTSADHKITRIRKYCRMQSCNIAHQIVEAISGYTSGRIHINTIQLSP